MTDSRAAEGSEAEARPCVLIAGGGPVGLALAGELGWRGIDCLLVEKGDGQVTQPKMDIVGVRTMEFCRRWGIVDWVENAGYNRERPQDYAWFTALAGYELGREPFPPPSDEPYPPQSPQRRERCPQNFFDPVLARFARRFPHVTIRYETELIGFEEHEFGVNATLFDRRAGREARIQASYLVGCDGDASTVRQRLGIGMSGSPVLTYTTNAIFRCKDFDRLHDKKPGYRYIFIGPEGTWCTIVAIDGCDRYRFSFVGDGTRRALSQSEVRAAIVRAMGREFDFEVLSSMAWVRREVIADAYGSKRVFVAGDAAHVMSPTGGFGMNTGIQDAVDLGWKLEAAVRGWAGAALLASYEAERRPVALRNAAEATGNLKRMLSPRAQPPPREIFEPGPAGDAARRRFGEAFTRMMKREWFTLGVHLGYRYEGSPLIVPDETPPPEDVVSNFQQTARPGHRAPHVWLEPGKSTLDLFGRAFLLLVFQPGAQGREALQEAARARGVPLRAVVIEHPEAAQVYERPLVLVRPDGHVAWRGDAAPDNAAKFIDIVRGAARM